ncbi:MAG TPA: cytidylate kinase-like family protein [Candidatus Baltobacteraceae bacterium]|nr:cytidylate kinase-like family protein [Candidatus Baltobacteraceae bacterium]
MIVTISREYGAGGLAVADAAARELGYGLLTDDVPKEVAARLGTTAQEVGQRASAERSLPERMLADLEAGSPESINSTPPRLPDEFDESVRREIERTLRERAAEGNLVILGRMGSAVLAGRPDLLRVFLTAPPGWRIERVMETFGRTRNEAMSDIEQLDAARRRFAKERYKIAWGNARCYDLVLDTARFGIEGAAGLIASAVRTLTAP